MFLTLQNRLLVVALLFATFSANAVVVSDLYTATTEAQNQSKAQRNALIPDALAQVLVRITGLADAKANPALAEMLQRSNSYMEQFRYIREERDGETVLKLSVRFDQRVIDRDLSARQLAIWGKERPKTLLVMVTQSADGRVIVGSDDDAALGKQLVDAANQYSYERGVPLVVPLMDLADQKLLPVAEVWGGFTKNYQTIMQRYGADAVLLGRFIVEEIPAELAAAPAPTEDGLEADEPAELLPPKFKGTVRWEVINGAASGARWSTVDRLPLTELVQMGAVNLAERYAKAYAIGGAPVASEDGQVLADSGELLLSISGLDSYSNYRAAIRHLATRAPVASVAVKHMSQARLVVAVELKGNLSQLKQALRLGRVLQASAPPAIQAPIVMADGTTVEMPLPEFPNALYYVYGR